MPRRSTPSSRSAVSSRDRKNKKAVAPAGPPSFALIDELDLRGLAYTAVRAALELDLFTTIAEGQHTVAEIAAASHASQHGTRVLLDALCPLGLLDKFDGAYALTGVSDTFFVRGKLTCCADAFVALWRNRDRLLDCVRTGAASLDFTAPEAEAIWAGLCAPDLLFWPRTAEAAREKWEQLGLTANNCRRLQILDLACGSGTKSFVLAQADPTVHVTAVDFPKVLAVAEQVAEMMDIRQQVTLCPGNLLTIELPAEQFDIARFGAILYYFDAEQISVALRKAQDALKPGGLVVIGSLQADEARCEAELPLLLAVELLHDAPRGEVYTFSEYQAFLDRIGFTDITWHNDLLISARK